MQGQSNRPSKFSQKGGKLLLTNVEYVTSFVDEKDIELYSLRLGYGTFLGRNLTLFGILDVSATNGFQVLDSNIQEEITKAESFGLGVSFLVKWYIFRFGKTRLFIDAGGGILYTFNSFPPSGTKLNFTARPGGGIAVELSSHLQVLVGMNRFHLSNGEGFKHPHNPAFDGLGIFAGIVFKVNSH